MFRVNIPYSTGALYSYPSYYLYTVNESPGISYILINSQALRLCLLHTSFKTP